MTDGQSEANEARGLLAGDLAAVKANIRKQQQGQLAAAAEEAASDPLYAPRLPEFAAVFAELDEVQKRKGRDYGVADDPLANLRSSEGFGFPAWVAVMIRIQDKLNRIKTFVRTGRLENESVEDSLVDTAVYAIHALRLYRETKD